MSYEIIDEQTIRSKFEIIKIPVGYKLLNKNDVCQHNDIYYHHVNKCWIEVDSYIVKNSTMVCNAIVCRPKIKNDVVIE